MFPFLLSFTLQKRDRLAKITAQEQSLAPLDTRLAASDSRLAWFEQELRDFKKNKLQTGTNVTYFCNGNADLRFIIKFFYFLSF